MNYRHLSINERACIFEFKNMGLGVREIAKRLERSPSTISRELNRNKRITGHTYHPVTSQKNYVKRRQNSHRSTLLTSEIKEYIENKLYLTWSPEQISNYKCEIDMPSYSTIYNWVNKKMIVKGDKTFLRRKGKSPRTQETRGRFNIGKPIRKRPRHVYNRKEIGHWEADTVVSGRGKGKSVLVTLVERKTRILHTCILPNRKEVNVTNSIIMELGKYPKHLVKSITVDRGKEFAGYNTVEAALECGVYFADAYCSWQRGTNENTNGLLREFFPKGSNFDLVNKYDVLLATSLINNRPRKCIGFSKPIDYIIKCCT